MAEIIIKKISTPLFEITITDSYGVTINLVNATDKTIKFKKKDGTTALKVASFLTDGTDGIITYKAETGFIDQLGLWSMQPIITMADGIIR